MIRGDRDETGACCAVAACEKTSTGDRKVIRMSWPKGKSPRIKTAAPKAAEGLSCVHRGGYLRTDRCGGCRGAQYVHVYECALYGNCTVERKLPGVRKCAKCRDRIATVGP